MNSAGFQIALELTNILPIRQAVNKVAEYTLDRTLKIARTLRSSGSDLLVEEDLAAVFGRVWVDTEISRRFKDDILRNTAIIPYSNDCALELRKGAGPTLDRAFRDREQRGYLETVIQLSFLCWTHDRTALASALSYCLNERFERDLPGATLSPGFDGLLGTLGAISSQASAFCWTDYFEPVRERIYHLYHGRVNDLNTCLPSGLLLSCLDSLCILQRMPEEYTLTVSGGNGCVILIIWAHHLLGLSVLLKSGNPLLAVLFSKNQGVGPNVIIEASVSNSIGPEVCLLDKNKEVQLKIDPSQGEFVPMEAAERIPLRGHSSINLCRGLNEAPSFKSSPEFAHAAEYAVAMAITLSRRIARVLDYDASTILEPCSISHWQIFEAATVLFPNIQFEEAKILEYAKDIPLQQALKDIKLEDVPEALQEYLAREDEVGPRMTTIKVAAVDILVMATVAGIGSCGKVLFIAEYHHYNSMSQIRDVLLLSKGPCPISATAFFGHVRGRLAGTYLNAHNWNIEETSLGVFMVSEFGWAVCLPTFGDTDPASVNPAKLFLREGVPTDKKTLERKSRVRDAALPTIAMMSGLEGNAGLQDWIVDSGNHTYKPRCTSPVTERSEFYGSRNDGFHHIIKFKGFHWEPFHSKSGWSVQFEVKQSYRALHDDLWGVLFAPPCEHALGLPGGLDSANLIRDVVTIGGNRLWYRTSDDRENPNILKKIVVVLVKGDARARWLAVGSCSRARNTRRTMLRGSNCCEECAVEAASKHSGKWFVII